MAYDHISLEQKWQKFWEEHQTFKTENPPSVLSSGTNVKDLFHGHVGERNSHNLLSEGKSDPSVSLRDDKNNASFSERPKKYILDMFPYPSGAGLHVGHPKGYTATDIVSRYYHSKGYNVLHPMGFDAFGLPAENYAVKTGTHPRITTEANIATFTSQMKALGFSYDWDRMVDTTDPEYYRWTQWIFLELFKRGLAYEAEMPVNWCPALKAVLANEEVVDGKSEIGGHPVEKKFLRQWVLRITEYADRLIEDLDGLDWPLGIKEMQRNWIGKSEGCEFRLMKAVNSTSKYILPQLFSISHATDDDFHEILRIRKETGYHSHEFSREQFLVLKKGEALIGFIRSRQIDGYYELGALYVGEEYRGKKLGYCLLDKAILGIDTEEIYIDCLQELEEYYTEYGFQTLTEPLDFQLKKSRALWKFYGEDLTDAEISKRLVFMKIPKSKIHIQKPTAILLHGWNNVENRTDWHWMSSTKSELEKIGYEVIMEQLPGNNAPDLEKQLAFLEQYKDRLDERSVIIGHSMGGFLGMHFVAGLGKKIDKLICVAPVYNRQYEHIDWSHLPSWEIGLHTMKQIYNEDAIKQNTNNWHVFLSEDDPWIHIKEAKNYFDSVNVQSTVVSNYGHICTEFFPILLDSLDHIRVYTTRVDTVYSMAFAVVAPDHPKVQDFIAPEQREVCEDYIRNTKAKTDLDRTNDGKEKTGVFSGSYVINPYNGEPVPLWIGDFVLGTYGTGAVFGDAHDERDFEFAKKYGIDLKVSILPASGKSEEVEAVKNLEICLTDDGILVNSGEYDGLTSAEARRVLAEKAETEGFGHKKINYKLRDWLFSRQRYWGEPIPLIHISEEDYAKLPRVQKIEDTKSGEASILVSSGVEQSGTKDLTQNGTDSPSENDNDKEYLVIDGKIFSEIYDGLTGKLIIDSSLPLLLPEVEKYEPSGDGQSPLATVPEWVNIRLADNLVGKRETNTMPQWGGSCWYYLRYMDNKNMTALASHDAMEYWQNVDEYVGGAEHAVLHLLYARFWHKVLYDIGVVPTLEPFQKLTNVGMILAYAYERADGGLVAVDLVEERAGKYYETSTGLEVRQIVAKMSKSLKNVVNPTDVVLEYGADTLRLYEMSMGAFTDTAPWNTDAIIGVRRFLDRVYATFVTADSRQQIAESGDKDMKKMKLLHKTVKKVGEDIVEYKFNTAISALMILLNEGIPTDPEFALEWKEKFTILLHPFAPHMAEELWGLCHPEGNEGSASGADSSTSAIASAQNDNSSSIYFASWPDYDDFMLVDDEVTIAVQVNGKLRGTLTCLNGVMQEEVSILAREDATISKWLEGKTLVREIFIPNKMLSIVMKD